MIDLKRRTQQEHAWKQAVTNDFLRGEDLAEIATRCGCARRRVENVIREAITGLSALVTKQQQEQA